MTTRLADSHLVLFFTQGMSLKKWDEVGMLEREVEIYRRLRPYLKRISFLTYGDRSELAYAPQLDGIEILCNKWGLPSRLYVRLIPFLYWRQMWRADIIKTNQTNGALRALGVKRLFHKKMIARCGYMWSIHASHRKGPQSSEAQRAVREEQQVFNEANRVAVTAPTMKRYVVERYGVPDTKVTVIPNYVNTDWFKPQPIGAKDGRTLCFIGRLIEQKNPFALLEAILGLNVKLLMIGGGPLHAELEAKARSDHLDVQFVGNVPHTQLPAYINQADAFVLPSLYEGHPKALLEAMACGIPVIGGDSPGIREFVIHGETGYLCETSPMGIREAIATLLADEALRNRLGSTGREFVVRNFSLERVVDMELELYASLMQ